MNEPQDSQFRDADSEQISNELSIQFLVLEQVRRCLRLAAIDPTNDRYVQGAPGKCNPRIEYVNSVSHLRSLISSDLDDDCNKELKPIDGIIKGEQQKKHKDDFDWFMYQQSQIIFTILCSCLSRLGWMSGGELT